MSTEKRLFLFLVLTFMVLAGYAALMEMFGPKRPAQGPELFAEPGPLAKDDQAKPPLAQPEKTDQQPAAVEKPAISEPGGEKPGVGADVKEKEAGKQQSLHPHRVMTLGSYRQTTGGSPLLVHLTSRGGALEQVELVGRDQVGNLRYRDLDNNGGYLGSLSLTTEPKGGRGCRIHAVPAGTPAALATCSDSGDGPGLRAGDVLMLVNGNAIEEPADLEAELKNRKPRDSVTLTIDRIVAGATKKLSFTATLDVRPFELIRPEPLEKDESDPHPASLLLSVKDASQEQGAFLDRLRDLEWDTKELNQPTPGVEFRYQITAAMAEDFGLAGPVEVVKRYRLGSPLGDPAGNPTGLVPAFHMDFEIELRNLGSQPQSLAYRLDGTNGLPTEGWWYLTKIHPRWFQSAGARDVVLRTETDGHRLIGCSAILSRIKKDEKSPRTPLFSEKEPTASRSLTYIGVDTQYFGAALIPQGTPLPTKPQLPTNTQPGTSAVFSRAEALIWGDVNKIPKGWERTANTTYQLTSEQIAVLPLEPFVQRFQLFAGPKDPVVLAAYGLGDWIYYGWFGLISRFLSGILHFFYAIFGNYGIAIILLTVLVRSCMFPVSRTAARNAAMMQELAPEMRKIAEKHKNNLEARGKAQQELFRNHNYNPLGGCWLMFLQLPVFIGLYRCLAVDIELRQAPLFSGLGWCSNLAGPDKLFFWKSDFFAYFTSESGWLGPYFNVLPIFTIVLFLLHQKLFTPPATDEQTEMQMKMMKFMTVFMGVMFYKVPAGLCLYFITSSLWGIAERKLIPKPTPKKKDEGGGGFKFASLFGPRKPPPEENGNARKKELERKMRRNK